MYYRFLPFEKIETTKDSFTKSFEYKPGESMAQLCILENTLLSVCISLSK